VDLDEYVFFDDGDIGASEGILLRRKRAKTRPYVCWPWRAGMRARRVEFYSFDLARVALEIANNASDQGIFVFC